VIDTHAHLDALPDPPGEVLARARAAGVARVVTIGSGLASCREALGICEREDGVYAALGIHPHEAGGAQSGDLVELRRLLAHPSAVAVGEAGLDHYRDYAPRERQLHFFRLQVELAEELAKPIVVHTRAADEETVAVLDGARTPVVLHCFSSVRLLEPALERGWYISFAGNATFPRATELRWAAAQVPGDRILVETDSPYLAPQPVRGRTNEPVNVVHTFAALALSRGEEPGGLAAQVDENASRVFGLP
jgi:TatD DNase family protein